ncbi:MAG: tryptophan-rich sensory protein [Opitutaceae bacterium]|nr:tryptophan-rich sensory protein [Opitutaceae bacterium]
MTSSSPLLETDTLKPAWPGLAGWLALCFAAPTLSFWARPDAWYALLQKPSWNPPGWVFGPVWTALYILMGVAAWLVWRRGGFRVHRRPLGLFLIQLALNALWTPLFFGLHSPALAFVDIVALWLAIVATLAAFRSIHRGAALLLTPYLAWVSFAAILNFTIWQLNR